MKKNKVGLFWFTLIELLVAIAIIGILALSSTNLNFNKISNKQKLINYNNKIISNIEAIRNNSLMWRGMWMSLNIPNSWRIDFSKSWSWKILTSYSWGIIYTEYNTIFSGWYYLDTIKCFDILWTELDSFTWNTLWTGILFISWDNITWSGSSNCNNIRNKKLEIITWYKNFTWSILINTVNWLVQKKY